MFASFWEGSLRKCQRVTLQLIKYLSLLITILTGVPKVLLLEKTQWIFIYFLQEVTERLKIKYFLQLEEAFWTVGETTWLNFQDCNDLGNWEPAQT